MQPCNRIYYSNVRWRLNMFRAAHRSSSGAPNCIYSLRFTCVTTCLCKPEAVNTVWSPWWWAVCCLKHVEPSANVGITNSITRLHLVGEFYWLITEVFPKYSNIPFFFKINQLDALISQIYFGMKLYMFQTVPLSIIRSFSLYKQQWYMSYKFVDSCWAGSGSCSTAVSKPLWHISLLCVQWKTPDDEQRNCPKHVEFHSKINLRNQCI